MALKIFYKNPDCQKKTCFTFWSADNLLSLRALLIEVSLAKMIQHSKLNSLQDTQNSLLLSVKTIMQLHEIPAKGPQSGAARLQENVKFQNCVFVVSERERGAHLINDWGTSYPELSI